MAEISGLTVKLDVDVSEAIAGLKAVQREAKKATQELRELEAQERPIKQTTLHTSRYLVVDLGEPTGEVLSYTIHRKYEDTYLMDTLRPIENKRK